MVIMSYKFYKDLKCDCDTCNNIFFWFDKGLSQMVLDAGQKTVGPRECHTCGLLYSPGDFEDEETHRKTHLSLINTFSLNVR